jgi:hypothetical protein
MNDGLLRHKLRSSQWGRAKNQLSHLKTRHTGESRYPDENLIRYFLLQGS